MSTSRTGTVLVICAPSGAGKTTLIKRLREEFPNFGYSISCTTRKPREGEENGKDYTFISVSDFKEKRDSGFFAESAKVHGNYYGTPLQATVDTLNAGQDLIFDVDVQGAAQLRLSLPSAVYVFILPPSMKELTRRLHERGSNTPEQIEQRINNALIEMHEAHLSDFIIVNDDLDTAYEQLRSVYIAATIQADQQPEFLLRLFNESDSVELTDGKDKA